jgi:hypothetical protein
MDNVVAKMKRADQRKDSASGKSRVSRFLRTLGRIFERADPRDDCHDQTAPRRKSRIAIAKASARATMRLRAR